MNVNGTIFFLNLSWFWTVSLPKCFVNVKQNQKTDDLCPNESMFTINVLFIDMRGLSPFENFRFKLRMGTCKLFYYLKKHTQRGSEILTILKI